MAGVPGGEGDLMLWLPLLLAAAPFYQDHAQYLSAIADDSTNTSFVLITVIDASTKQTKTGCVGSNFLIGAISREYRFPWDASGQSRATVIASTPSHRFTFRSRAALANVGFARFERQNPEECALIRHGCAAVRGDAGGNLLGVCDAALRRRN